MLLFIMQVTAAVPIHVSAVNCNFRYGNCQHVWDDNIMTYLRELGCGGVDWIGLAQDRDRWRALGTAVMNLWFHKLRGISWPAENLLASQEALCCMDEWVSVIMITHVIICVKRECCVYGSKQLCGYVLQYYSALFVCLSQLMFVILPYIYS